MADTDIDVRETRDPIMERIRSRVNPLDSSKDFKLYEAEKGAYTADLSHNSFRALVHLPPINSDGMTEVQRQQLLARYTEMLGKLKEVEASMKSEDMKSQRGYMTAMSNLASALLKYKASEDATYGQTVSSAHSAGVERMRALATEQDLYGTATLPDRVRTKYSEDIKALAPYVSADGTVSNAAAFERGLIDSMRKIDDPREIVPFLATVTEASGVSDPAGFITKLAANSPVESATHKSLQTILAKGDAAYASARTRQEEVTAKVDEVDRTFDERAGAKLGWVDDLLKMTMRGISGVDTKPPPELAAALGLTPQEAAGMTGGAPGVGAPGVTGTSEGSRTEMNPYTKDAKAHIEHQIDELMKGTDPHYVQIRKAMIASDAFKTFKEQHGYENDDVAFEAWGKAAKFHASKSKADTRAAMDREILSGRQEANVFDQAGARVRTALRDLFAPKGKAPVPEAAAAAVEAETEPAPPLGTPGPTAEDTSPTKPAPASAAASPSAGITKGSSPPVSSEEKASGVGQKQEATTSTEYRIVNDPRNSDYIYRQYADGKIELIGDPGDPSVSPKNPRVQTGKLQKRAEDMIGKYEKPSTADPNKDRLDLSDVQGDREKPSGENYNATPQAKARSDVRVAALTGIGQAAKEGTKLGASGPDLKLDRDGEIVKMEDAPHEPEDVDPNLVKPEEKGVKGVGNSKGGIDYSKDKADTLINRPAVDRKAALKPLTTEEMETPLDQKLNPGLGPVSPEEQARRKKMTELLRGYDYDNVVDGTDPKRF